MMENWTFGADIQFEYYLNAFHCIHSWSPFSPKDVKDSDY